MAAVVVLATAAVADAADRGARAGAPRDLERSAAPSVRARMCSRPSEWRWSSYPAVLGASPQPSFLTGDWLLAFFGNDRHRARGRLRAFVEDEAENDAALLSGRTP